MACLEYFKIWVEFFILISPLMFCDLCGWFGSLVFCILAASEVPHSGQWIIILVYSFLIMFSVSSVFGFAVQVISLRTLPIMSLAHANFPLYLQIVKVLENSKTLARPNLGCVAL